MWPSILHGGVAVPLVPERRLVVRGEEVDLVVARELAPFPPDGQAVAPLLREGAENERGARRRRRDGGEDLARAPGLDTLRVPVQERFGKDDQVGAVRGRLRGLLGGAPQVAFGVEADPAGQVHVHGGSLARARPPAEGGASRRLVRFGNAERRRRLRKAPPSA